MEVLETLRIGFFQFWHNAPYFLLCCAPFLPRLRVSRRTLAAATLCTGVLISLYYALRETAFPALRGYHDGILLGFYLLYFVLYRRYFAVSPAKLLYVFLVVQAYSTAINVICKFVDVRLFPEHFSKVTATSYSLMVIGLLALSYPFLWRFFTRRLRRAFDDLPDSGFWRFAVVPGIFFVINQIYINLLYGRMFRETGRLEPQTFLIFLLVLAAEFIVYFFTLRTAMATARHVRDMAELANTRMALELQARGYDQLTRSIEAARAARHDLRHHLAAMDAYIQSDDKQGLSAYLEQYRRSLPGENEPPLCQNYVVDAVTRHYLALARAAGAVTDVRLDLPARMSIPDSDLTVLFGNLFENAANALARQTCGPRLLTARCMLQNGMLVLTLDNSSDRPGGREERGVGQSSVAALAEKYGGTARFEREGTLYRASVLLHLPDAPQNEELKTEDHEGERT